MDLRLEFAGAVDTVTGSRTLLHFGSRSWLVDSGLFQGDKEFRARNWNGFADRLQKIEGVLLTHAHLDHSGYLPRMVHRGWSGQIHATDGTADLARLLLLDAAHLEEEFAEYANKAGYSNHKPALPLFTEEDALGALSLFRRYPRQTWFSLCEGVSFRFLRAGHIIGASLIQLHCKGAKGHRLITFSGDLGNGRSTILRSPVTIQNTDILVLESTYGDRLQPREPALDDLAAIANETFRREGTLVIPAFAVGRAQELVYLFRMLEDQGRIPTVPVVLDSPMAQSAMEICLRHEEDHILGSAFLGSGNVYHPRHFEVTQTPDESMMTCMRSGPQVVISASGMLSGGRILHHLKARLPDERNTVLFTGYQAEGTKGRWLQDHAGLDHVIRIHHQDVPINAQIKTLDALSAHADWQDILEWLGHIKAPPELVILNHGHPDAQRSLAEKIRAKFGWKVQPVCERSEFLFQI